MPVQSHVGADTEKVAPFFQVRQAVLDMGLRPGGLQEGIPIEVVHDFGMGEGKVEFLQDALKADHPVVNGCLRAQQILHLCHFPAVVSLPGFGVNGEVVPYVPCQGQPGNPMGVGFRVEGIVDVKKDGFDHCFLLK